MHILRPHRHNPIEVVRLNLREAIACPSCGSDFRPETDAATVAARGGPGGGPAGGPQADASGAGR